MVANAAQTRYTGGMATETETETLYGIQVGDTVRIDQPGGDESTGEFTATDVNLEVNGKGNRVVWLDTPAGVTFYVGEHFAGSVIVNGEKREAV